MSLDAFSGVFADGEVLAWLGNSPLVGVAVTALTVTSLAASGLSRTRFRGRSLVLALLVVGTVMPPQMLIVPLFAELVDLGLGDTY
jgi:multiple sugar transport system permease protein